MQKNWPLLFITAFALLLRLLSGFNGLTSLLFLDLND